MAVQRSTTFKFITHITDIELNIQLFTFIEFVSADLHMDNFFQPLSTETLRDACLPGYLGGGRSTHLYSPINKVFAYLPIKLHKNISV